MREQLYPKQDHAELATSLNELGCHISRWKGDDAEAGDYYLRALAMRERLYPPARYPNGHTDLGVSYNGLAAFFQNRGDYAQAEAYSVRALAVLERLYPVEKFPDGHNTIAVVLQAAGRHLLVSR